MDFLTNPNLLFYLAAYLAGGIPFGLLLAKRFVQADITREGSGGIGATNVLRVVKEKNPALAKQLAIATLVLDAIKGVAVLAVAIMMQMPPETLWAVAVLGVVGHCFSPYLFFEGGKGVATAAGVLLVMLPLPTLIALGIWGILAKTVRISSLASLGGVAGLIVASYLLYPDMAPIGSHAPVWIIAIIVVYKHLPNIIRLVTGQERQVV